MALTIIPTLTICCCANNLSVSCTSEFEGIQAHLSQKPYNGAMISVEKVQLPDKVMVTGQKGVSENKLKKQLTDFQVVNIKENRALIKLGKHGKEITQY